MEISEGRRVSGDEGGRGEGGGGRGRGKTCVAGRDAHDPSRLQRASSYAGCRNQTRSRRGAARSPPRREPAALAHRTFFAARARRSRGEVSPTAAAPAFAPQGFGSSRQAAPPHPRPPAPAPNDSTDVACQSSSCCLQGVCVGSLLSSVSAAFAVAATLAPSIASDAISHLPPIVSRNRS